MILTMAYCKQLCLFSKSSKTMKERIYVGQPDFKNKQTQRDSRSKKF
jgi:hypothetical protein